MRLKTNQKRHYGATAAYLDQLLQAGRVAFSLSQLMEQTGISESAAKNQLRRLGARIVRVAPKQAFFLIVEPEHSVAGCPPADLWLDDYFAWLGHPYYLALQTAAGIYGSSPQAIQVTQVMTDTPRRALAIGRRKIVFFVKRRIRSTLTQPVSSVPAPLKASSPASTVFDLIRYAGQVGGIGRAVETARPLLAKMTVRDLRATLDAEDENATSQRLGFITEKTGHEKLAATIDRWLPPKRPLTPLACNTSATTGSLAPRWQVNDNTKEFDP